MEELEQQFEIPATAGFIQAHGFVRIALQFPDELLRHSVGIVSALERFCDDPKRRFFVMADTTFGSCCVDEVAAAHVNADCIIHFGRACLSPISRLPVRFVFGKSPLQVDRCSRVVAELSASSKLLVLYDLSYAHTIPELREALESQHHSTLTFAEVVSEELWPSIEPGSSSETQHEIAGLRWESPNMEEHQALWIGVEGPALTSFMLTFSLTTTVRFDPETGKLHDMSTQSETLGKRYYLIERAKDASIVGIVVGTLGVAGYNQAIQRVKKIVKEAGKKSYTLAVGKPNPAKLANFPECDVFVMVACPQTALIDSKEYLSPLITTFEAEMAFVRGSEWSGSYCLDFRKSQLQNRVAAAPATEEPHFSFIKGGYVSSATLSGAGEEEGEGGVAGDSLVTTTSSTSSLSLQDPRSSRLKLASEFFQTRSFQGLELDSSTEPSFAAIVGQTGRAAVYDHEHKT